MKKLLLTGAALMALSLTAKAQSSCEDALELQEGITTIGTIEGEYYAEGCWASDNDEATAANWYMVTAPADGTFRLNTNVDGNDPAGDSRVAVYSGECGDLTCWSSSDDKYFGYIYNDAGEPVDFDPNNVYYADFSFPVLEGATYYIAFDNNYANEGYDVELTFTEPNCSTNSLTEDWTNLGNWYFCWSRIDQNADQNGWSLFQQYDFDGDYSYDNTAVIFSSTAGNDDYLLSSGKNLVAGTEYTINVIANGVNTVDADENEIEASENYEVVILADTQEGGLGLVESLGTEEGITMNGEAFAELRGNAIESSFYFTPEFDATYYVALRSTADTGGALLIFEVNVDGAMGTGKNLLSETAVYPNPANSVVNVANATALINNVKVADLNGRTVKTQNFENVSSAQVNISDLASGVYMMTVASDKGTTTKKIVKN